MLPQIPLDDPRVLALAKARQPAGLIPGGTENLDSTLRLGDLAEVEVGVHVDLMVPYRLVCTPNRIGNDQPCEHATGGSPMNRYTDELCHCRMRI